MRDSGGNRFELPVSSFDVSADGVQEFFDGRASVVSHDVGMQILPDAFDSIVLRTVWWQEVQCNSVASRIAHRA